MGELLRLLAAWTAVFNSWTGQRLAWTLLHFLWQGAAVGVAAGLALGRVHPHRAHTRAGVAALALIVLAILPPLTFLRAAAWPAIASALASLHGRGLAWPGMAPGTASTAVPVARVHGSWLQAGGFTSAMRWLRPWLLSLWGLGVVLGGILWFASWRKLRRLCRSARPASGEWTAAARTAAGQLGLKLRIRVLESEQVTSPFVAGVLRPVILVPQAMRPAATSTPDTTSTPDAAPAPVTALTPASAPAALSAGDRARILAHELAHLLRRDPWINLVQSWTEILFFFHPAVWFTSRRLRIEREHCCDDLAVQACGDPLGYARALAALEESRRTLPAFALGSGVSLRERVTRVLNTAPQPTARSRRLTAVAALAAVVLVVVGAALPPAPRAEQKGGAHPEVVFDRLMRAYETRDLELLKSCFTEDYVFEWGPGESWGLKDEVLTEEHLFSSKLVTYVTLKIDYEHATVRQLSPDTWIFDNFAADLAIGYTEDGKSKVNAVSNPAGKESMTVRLVAGPEPSYRICHWLERKSDK